MVFDYSRVVSIGAKFEGQLFSALGDVLVNSLAPSLRSRVSLSVISGLCWQWCLRGSPSMYCILRYWGLGAKVLRLESGNEGRCV